MIYDFLPKGEHVLYPASHEPTGGPNGGGHVWMDYSRTNLDVPDDNSYLVFINYVEWINPRIRRKMLDLGPVKGRPRVVRFQLKSDGADLHGGNYYFWALDINGRMHKTAQPLETGNNGAWGPVQEVELGSLDQWAVTYKNRIDFSRIRSFGISLRGAAVKPADACTLGLGGFAIGL